MICLFLCAICIHKWNKRSVLCRPCFKISTNWNIKCWCNIVYRKRSLRRPINARNAVDFAFQYLQYIHQYFDMYPALSKARGITLRIICRIVNNLYIIFSFVCSAQDFCKLIKRLSSKRESIAQLSEIRREALYNHASLS